MLGNPGLTRLGEVEAICLTASCHERSAWQLRRKLRVPVYGPEGGVDFEESPDHWYQADSLLPGGLQAVHAPGPTEAHYAFYLNRHGGVVFCAETDVVRRGVAESGDLEKLTVEKIMSFPMASIESIRSVQDAHDMMADLGIRHLVVREAGKVVGVLSARDLLVYFKSVSEPKIAQD